MLEFFSQIGDIFKAIIDFVMMIVNGIVTMLVVIPRSMVYLVECVAFLPPLVLPFAMITIFGSLIMFLIGRKSDKG